MEESKLQNGSGLGLRYDYYIKLADDTYKNTKNASADELRNADIYQIEVRYNGSTDSSILEEAIVSEIQKNVGSDIVGATTYNLTAQSYSTMGSLNGTNNESKINRPGYEHELIETPVEPDLWIQHSSEQNHRTGISRYSMDAISMGIAFTNVRTQANQSTQGVLSLLQ